MLLETTRIYKLAEVDGKKVCHFCCFFASDTYPEMYYHMWLHHSQKDFDLFGWAPWLVYNGTASGELALQTVYKALGAAVTLAKGIDANEHQAALMQKGSRANSSAGTLRGAAQVNFEDFIYGPVPELMLLRIVKVFRPFQSPMQDYQEFTVRSVANGDELRFFYPVFFFNASYYACQGWLTLMKCFHILAKVKLAKSEIKACSDGITGVCITTKNDAPGRRVDLVAFMLAEKLRGQLDVPLT